jgi:formylglycine-generating enzyme
MVRIPNLNGRVWIDQFEASVEFVENNAWILHPFNIPLDALDGNGTRYRAVSPLSINASFITDNVKPQAYISQEQASNACLAANKRLCTLAEYMAACSANGSATFPYGEQHIPGACNEGHANPVITVYGNDATFNLTELNNPILDTLPNTLSPSGFYALCTNNVTQTFDMSGNLDEWVSDRTSEGHGVFKGGYFVDATINGPGCTYMTVAHDPTYHDYSLGFRCCYG